MNAQAQTTPRWPPVENGLPAETASMLIETQRDLLIALRHAIGEDDSLWERHYWPVIARYLRWVHLLPASREHHHYGAGGLWCHGLEVARAAADLYDRRVVGQDLPHEQRRQFRRGLRWAAVCGGLLHDCAKPLTDVEITDDNGNTWNPVQGSLMAWLQKTLAPRYRLRWRQGRDDRHLVGAAIMLPRILGLEAQVWLQSLCGQSVLIDLVEAVMDDTRQGLLAEIIHEADRLSVAEDLSRRGELTEDHRIVGVAAERHIIDAMQSLLREGRWRAGGKVCIAAPDGEVVLAWPRAGKAIGEWLAEHGIPGVVRSPEGIANVLIDTGKAVSQDGENFWRFKMNEGLTVTGLRLKPGLLDLGDAPVGGEWVAPKEPKEPTASKHESSTPANPHANEQPNGQPDTNSPGNPTNPTSETSELTPVTEDDIPEETIQERVKECVIAHAIFEDIASGKTPLKAWYRFEGHTYLAYPDAFKGYGMSPIQAVKDLIEAEIVEADGKRVAVETGKTKGAKLTFNGPPLSEEAITTHLAEWFKHQTQDVVDIREVRFIELSRVERWADLFGDGKELVKQLQEANVVRLGNLKDNRGNVQDEKTYVRQVQSGADGTDKNEVENG